MASKNGTPDAGIASGAAGHDSARESRPIHPPTALEPRPGNDCAPDDRYRALIESMDAGFCVLEMLFDEDGRAVDYRWLETNPSFERHTGLVDAVGRTAREMIPGLEEHWVETYGQVATTGTPRRFIQQSRAMGRWFEVDAFRIDDPSLRRVALLFTDITDRTRTEQALRESEERLRLAAEAAGFGTYDFDVESGEAYWSEQLSRMCGCQGRNRFDTERMRALVHVDDRAGFDDMVQRSMDPAGPGRHDAEYRIVPSDGQTRWVRDVGRTYFDGDGPGRRALRVVGTVQDVTKRKRAEEALCRARDDLERRVAERTAELQLQATRLRDLAGQLTSAEHRERKRLAAVLHDELQQYLVAAKMRLQGSRRHVAEGPAAASIDASLQMIDHAVESSRDLTRQLRPPVLYEDGLVAALNWLASEMRQRHGLTVLVDAPGDEPALDDDAKAMLFEGVRELLFNVVKHAGASRARVRIARADASLHIRVEDDGVGLPADAMQRSTDPTSTGMGLFSVGERLAALGGTMDVDPEPGRGARITLEAPLQPAPPPSAAESAFCFTGIARGEEPEGHAGEIEHRPRVLLVDDHALVRTGIATLLRDDPRIEVIGEAGDGVEGLALIERRRPDVVLMDLNMPRMNGAEATREIRRRWPGIQVIGLSVQDDEASVRTLGDAGAAAFVSKADEPDRIREAIFRVHAARHAAAGDPRDAGEMP